MRYLSLFCGIEAASVAWQPLLWQSVAFAEIEPFACAVLAHHYPDVPNLGDVAQITEAQIAALGPIDIVVGGSPCQGLSQAGKRAGLADARSALFHEQVRIFHAAGKHCGARWLVWENVPGALGSNQRRDFAVVVGSLAGCRLPVPADGWGQEGVALGEHGLLEWAVLDAQWFGLAQRRKRVFAVLDTGNWADRPPVLLERDSLRGDCPARRESGQEPASPPEAGAAGTGAQQYVPATARCLNAGAMGRRDAESETFVVHGSQAPDVLSEHAHTLGRNQGQENVVCAFQERGRPDGRRLDIGGDIAYALTAPSGGSRTQENNIHTGHTVRRLTPRECERLQGFPDDYTRIAWRGKSADHCPDGPRYRALGNSMAVPVMRWIGGQIDRAAGKP